MSAHHAAQRHGGRLRLAAPSPAVAETLGIVGLTEVIPCHPTLRDALWPRQPDEPSMADARHSHGGHQEGDGE
ncbi:STAS domain-containing protein [Streptomyces sp. NPDC001817]|uniref:STAS domain-containing protein n=1 Tax=Streptomyces sp. NPDC001817 TaxID=3154398 RepID=UPI00332F62FC